MATPRRRTTASVINKLQLKPQAFDFFQAVRMLSTSESDTTENKGIRFNSRQNLSFATGEIESFETDNNNHHLQVNFLGLTGAQGIMPYHYTELILQRQRLKDHALAEYLNIFNQRTLELFYQAWKKYRLPFSVEHQIDGSDPHSQALLALCGLNSEQQNLPVSLQGLMQFSGLLSGAPKSACNLQQMISSLFNVKTEVIQFRGAWLPLPKDLQTRISAKNAGINNQLGLDTSLGDQSWQMQSRFEIKLGPLSQQDYKRLSPNGKTYQALNQVIDLYAGTELDFDITLLMEASELPQNQYSGGTEQAIMGWNSQLGAAPTEELLEIKLTPSRQPNAKD